MSSFAFIKSAAFSAKYRVCYLHFNLMPCPIEQLLSRSIIPILDILSRMNRLNGQHSTFSKLNFYSLMP